MSFPVTQANPSRISQIDFNQLPFGRIFSDHMFVADYQHGAWVNARIIPFSPISLSPAGAVLHYGQAIFEGMKVYKNEAGELLYFRPYENYKRMQSSAIRLCMPPVPEEIFMDGLKELIKLDQAWIPTGKGRSLYIRPVYFATDDVIGVKASENYTFIIFTSPTGPYYTDELKVEIEKTYSRSNRGGTGYAKAAGNYGGALYPTRLAQQRGYNQVIWTDAATHSRVEESGTMNLMFVINNVLVTPSLSPSKLAGITRDSVIRLAQHWGMKVEERDVYVEEILTALENGTLQEAFGTGTAANIAPISVIGHEGKDFRIPEAGPETFAGKALHFLDELKAGKIEDPFGWVAKL
ncbi:MAG: branched-chain amino acid aminotransferase [Bacteroidia bacterium]|jgi:branched-chain amino acid aminotransferase|nr:branched-chain amino acid aminotransferase [Bacteroidia bacterium]MCC6768297.1 branched-chain amino acid aminotransferase [Bacteroidia bacterium]